MSACLPELTLAEKLKRLRGSESQQQAAHRIGIAPSTLCLLEKGQRAGSTHRTITRIAQAYGIPVEYLTEDLRTYMRTWAEAHLGRDGSAATPGQRLAATLAELERSFGVTLEQVAEASRLGRVDLELALRDQSFSRQTYERMHEVTGVPAELLLLGPALDGHVLERYSAAILRAVAQGITPEHLLLLMERQVGSEQT